MKILVVLALVAVLAVLVFHILPQLPGGVRRVESRVVAHGVNP